MNSSSSFVLFALISIFKLSYARNYYDNRPKIYYTDDENGEQASRDLDMTFSAGDPTNYDNNIIHPLRKDIETRTRIPIVNVIHRENDRPIYLYKWPTQLPSTRKIIYGGDLFGLHENNENREMVNINNERKGEVVLELRVIANNNGFE